jgi:hypothetical protein
MTYGSNSWGSSEGPKELIQFYRFEGERFCVDTWLKGLEVYVKEQCPNNKLGEGGLIEE